MIPDDTNEKEKESIYINHKYLGSFLKSSDSERRHVTKLER